MRREYKSAKTGREKDSGGRDNSGKKYKQNFKRQRPDGPVLFDWDNAGVPNLTAHIQYGSKQEGSKFTVQNS